jgi:ATP-dependent DNA helicase PIF1
MTNTNDQFQPTNEQLKILNLFNEGKNVFINAPAGTGKSELLKYHFSKVKSLKVVGLTSTTGISAINVGGTTLHSYLGIGLGVDSMEELYYKILNNKAKHELWLNLSTLIIDEISMLHPDLFNKLEKVARKIRNNKLKFGGIQLIVTGDLFQLPCVSHNSALIINSSKFRACIDHVVELETILRQTDYNFQQVLNKIRLGIIDHHVKEVLESRFITPLLENKERLATRDGIQPTRLYCVKKSVNHLNEKELDKLASKGYEFKEYKMLFHKIKTETSPSIDQNTFDYVTKNFIKNSTTPSTLQICEEVQVMLTYNISSDYVNGSRGVVVGFTEEDYPIIKFINGTQLIIKPIKFSLYAIIGGEMKLIGYAIQIPLKVAYALTIHTSQGSTLDFVIVDLSETFEYGQAYTALSRVRTLDGLFIKKFNFDVIKAHPEALKFKEENNY